ncbi:MAG: NAD-dependent epimerase/dehydratase family protein [Clostridiales bacterium]|nr:NAD-dependent epimerase/dehydratase family protein [Clostridiales bacterium]
MRVVIIGGTGNISTSIVRVLLEKGHDVTCFNRGKSGTLPEGVRQIIGDRYDRESFEKTMQAEKFDGAIDMICFNAEDAESDVRAFQSVGHFVFCSTTCTYGVDYDWLPTTEDHPQRAFTSYGKNKVTAERVFLREYYASGFPAVIIRPSTTYGNKLGLLRQIAWDYSWLDRIRKGKPILVSGDGKAIHQFLHVDDAAYGFVGALERDNCIGQAYNLVRDDFYQFDTYHRTAMEIIGREVPMIGIPLDTLTAIDVKRFQICFDEFAFNDYYSSAKIYRDIPEFRPKISLKEGMTMVLDSMERDGRIPNSDDIRWEDDLIELSMKLRDYKFIG